ncbi:MAG: hypothetical protein JWR09_5052 [Mucilaginibacter sp.]|nr:hypothetical protein [Mucilaginibacter sp.]
MEINQFQNLLNQVNAITNKYKKVTELTGENFNVFRILKVESSEVKTHSAFIAELLNPNGSHGQKDTFLKLFIKAFCFKENTIDSESCKVKVEESIGTISHDRTQGGRIDIIIKDVHNHHIIIENKIYAGDQVHQLTRYYNYSDNADIIYLTLDGKSPSKDSMGDMEDGKHFKCYSYEHDILNWLELCRKEVAIYPIVREAITHYINLIKYLTNQTINQSMEEELSELLKSHLEASFTITDNLNKACEKVSNDFGKIIKYECEKIGLQCEYEVNFESRYSGIWVYKTEWQYFNIGFGFQNYDKDLIYGFLVDLDPITNPIPIELRNQIKALPNSYKSTDWWPWYNRLETPYNNWSKFEAWKAILNGSMTDIILDKIKFLLDITKDIKL